MRLPFGTRTSCGDIKRRNGGSVCRKRRIGTTKTLKHKHRVIYSDQRNSMGVRSLLSQIKIPSGVESLLRELRQTSVFAVDVSLAVVLSFELKGAIETPKWFDFVLTLQFPVAVQRRHVSVLFAAHLATVKSTVTYKITNCRVAPARFGGQGEMKVILGERFNLWCDYTELCLCS
jgi:hypothetical protein